MKLDIIPGTVFIVWSIIDLRLGSTWFVDGLASTRFTRRDNPGFFWGFVGGKLALGLLLLLIV